MYDLGSALPAVEPGTSLLCVGPSMGGTDAVLYRTLGAAAADGAGVIVVSTEDDARSVLDRFTAAAPAEAGDALAVVDCAARSGGADGDGGEGRVRRLSSPADLTGVAMALSDLIGRMGAEYDRVVVGFDSLAALTIYADPDRIFRFVHEFVRTVATNDAVALATLGEDAVDDEVRTRLISLFDVPVAVRLGDDGRPEVRLADDAPGGAWTPVEPAVLDETTGGGTPLRERIERTAVPESLAGFIDEVADEGLTLTVRGYDGRPAVIDDLRSFFDRQPVDVVVEDDRDERLSGHVLLHRDGEVIAGSSVGALYAAVEVGDGEREAGTPRTDRDAAAEAVIAAATGAAFGSSGADRSLLVRASRTVELLAYRRGEGRLHASFQELSRLYGDPDARRVYRRLADRGIDLHVYGVPDVDAPDWPNTTVHPVDSREARAAWFVVYDGGGAPGDAGAVVARERDPGSVDVPGTGRYEGFWTYDPDTVARALAYVERSFGSGEDSSTPPTASPGRDTDPGAESD